MNNLTPTPTPPDPGYQGYGPIEEYGAPSSSFRIKRFLAFLKRYWWIPVLTLILSLGAATGYVLTAPPTFVSQATMWETEKLRLPDGAVFTADLQNYLGTQLELLRSGRMQQLALNRLGASGTNAIPLDKDGKPPKVSLKVVQAPKSSVFSVEASSPYPEFTQGFLAALINQYLEYKKDVRKMVSGDTVTSISSQVTRMETDLKENQDRLTTFQRTNNLAVLQEENTVAGGHLAKLKTQLSDLRLELQLLEATALDQEASGATNANTSAFLVDSLRGSSSPSTTVATAERQTAVKEVEVLKMQRAKLSKYMRPKHPKIVRLDAEIERGQKIIEMYRNQNREQLAAARQAIKMKIESIDGSIKEWEVKVVEASAQLAGAERLRMSVNRSQAVYDRLAALLQNVDISRNIDQETTTVLEPATTAQRSYRHEIMALGLSLFAGLALGIGIVFLIEVRDDRLISLVEVMEKLNDNIVGQVPEMRAIRHHDSLPLLEEDDERHMYAEAYRNLRSALLYLPVDGMRPKTLLVTSAMPNEGKSAVAANLARALAFAGANVLLIDGDLRCGNLHKLFGLPAEPGLNDLLRSSIAKEATGDRQPEMEGKGQRAKSEGQKSEVGGQRSEVGGQRSEVGGQRSEVGDQRTEDRGQPNGQPLSTNHSSLAETLLAFDGCIQSTPVRNLALLARGNVNKGFGELFLSPAFSTFLDRARCLFDYIVIDSVPVFAADDTTSLAPKMDGVLFVVRRGFSSAGVVREALDLLYQRQTKILGLVFNRADSSARSYHYYKNGDYHRPRQKA